MNRFFLFMGILASIIFCFTACQPPPQIIVPELDTLLVQFTPATRPVLPALQACGPLLTDVELLLEESFADQAKPGLLIRIGEPQSAVKSMAQIASEELAVVLNPDNPAASLSIEQIRDLFTGQITNWADLGSTSDEVSVQAYYPGDEAQQAFDEQVLAGVPLSSSAILFPDPDALREAVSADPAAIGLLPSAWVPDGLKSTLVGIRLPVLVISIQPLGGSAAELVACLQGETGQAILNPIYP